MPKRRRPGEGSWDQIRRGDRTYARFRITLDGRVIERTGPSRQALEKEAASLIRRARQRLLGDDEEITLRDWALERWLPAKRDELGPAGAKTVRNYTSVLNAHVVPLLGGIKVRDLRADHRRRLQRALVAKGLKVSTVNKVDDVLRFCLQAAANEELPVVVSVLTAVKHLKAAPEKKRNLGADAVRRILAVARGQPLEDDPTASADAAPPPTGHQEAVAGVTGPDAGGVDEGVVPGLVGPLRPRQRVGLGNERGREDRALVAEHGAEHAGLPVVAEVVAGVEPRPDGAAVLRHQDHLLAGADEPPASGTAGAAPLQALGVVGPHQRQRAGVGVPDRQPVPAEGRRWFAAWMTYAYTGARDAEVRALRWSDWDQEAGTITIRRQLPQSPGDPPRWQAWIKGRKVERVVPVVEPLAAALREHRARQNEARLKVGKGMWSDYGLIFCDEVGRALKAQMVGRAFHRACEDAGIAVWKGLGVHRLRGAANEILREAGVDAPTRSAVLGHTVAVNEGFYVDEGNLRLARQAMGRLADALG